MKKRRRISGDCDQELPYKTPKSGSNMFITDEENSVDEGKDQGMIMSNIMERAKMKQIIMSQCLKSLLVIDPENGNIQDKQVAKSMRSNAA